MVKTNTDKKGERTPTTVLITPELAHQAQFIAEDLGLADIQEDMERAGIKNAIITAKVSSHAYGDLQRHGLEYFLFDNEGNSQMRIRDPKDVFCAYDSSNNETSVKVLCGCHLTPSAIFINSVRGTSVPYSSLRSLYWQGKLLGSLLAGFGRLSEQKDDLDREPYLLKLWGGKEYAELHPLVVMRDKLTTIRHEGELADWISEERVEELVEKYGGRPGYF